MKLLHKGTVKDHKLIFDNPEAFTVTKTLLEGKRFELTLEKEINRRTSPQNRYYRGVVVEAVRQLQADYHHCQMESDEMHNALREMFASHRTDNGLLVLEETHIMSTVRFTEYIDDIKRWALGEYGIRIPDAGEVEL